MSAIAGVVATTLVTALVAVGLPSCAQLPYLSRHETTSAGSTAPSFARNVNAASVAPTGTVALATTGSTRPPGAAESV